MHLNLVPESLGMFRIFINSKKLIPNLIAIKFLIPILRLEHVIRHFLSSIKFILEWSERFKARILLHRLSYGLIFVPLIDQPLVLFSQLFIFFKTLSLSRWLICELKLKHIPKLYIYGSKFKYIPRWFDTQNFKNFLHLNTSQNIPTDPNTSQYMFWDITSHKCKHNITIKRSLIA